MCMFLYLNVCVCICECQCTCVFVGLLYTVLGAKTLEIALIWILCVASNHNHVTGSPRLKRLIHGAETRSCVLLLYVHFILLELCSQNGSPYTACCRLSDKTVNSSGLCQSSQQLVGRIAVPTQHGCFSYFSTHLTFTFLRGAVWFLNKL